MSLLGAADLLTEFTSQKLTKSLLAQRAMRKKVTADAQKKHYR
jgi:hypothetical protein